MTGSMTSQIWNTMIALVALAPAACSRAEDPAGSPPARRVSAPAAARLPAPMPPGDGVRARSPAQPPPRPLSLAAEAGKQLFFDAALSVSGEMSCATCHDPAHAYGPPNDRSVQLGGPRGRSPGLRAVPSLRYKEFTPGYADLLDNSDGFSP